MVILTAFQEISDSDSSVFDTANGKTLCFRAADAVYCRICVVHLTEPCRVAVVFRRCPETAVRSKKRERAVTASVSCRDCGESCAVVGAYKRLFPEQG